MRILLITQWFEPEPLYKGTSLAKKLMEHGHTVQVLTGFPNYPQGKLYEGYRIKLFHRERIQGIDVLRVPLYPSHDNSAVGRVTNYLSFALSASLLGPWLVRKADLCYVYHPPPTTYLPAFWMKLLRRMRLVYDIQDFWPDTLAATGMFNNRIGLKAVDLYCRLLYKMADRLVVLSPGFRKKLMDKGVPQEKIAVIYNWCDDGNIDSSLPDPRLADELGMTGRFNVLFAGNMGKAQKLDTALKAAGKLSTRHPRVQFVFIGGGVDVPRLRELAAKMNLSNVLFLSPRPPGEIGAILALADVLLVHLRNHPLFAITVPSKIQSYMAAGKPILVAVPGDACELVEKARCGISCPSEDADELARTVEKFLALPAEELARMGTRGQHYYRQHLCMDVGVSSFESLFRDIIARKSSVQS